MNGICPPKIVSQRIYIVAQDWKSVNGSRSTIIAYETILCSDMFVHHSKSSMRLMDVMTTYITNIYNYHPPTYT